jgi:hypothetical protein
MLGPVGTYHKSGQKQRRPRKSPETSAPQALSPVLKARRSNDTLIFRRHHSVNPKRRPQRRSPCPLDEADSISGHGLSTATAARGRPYEWVFGVYSRPKAVTGGSS